MGKVYLTGAGPGDAGMLTLRALELIKNADAVVFDRLVGEDILALIPESAKKVDVGKSAGLHPVPQEEICEILLREAREHEAVVRLKGGDPFLFGRGGEEAEYLLAGGVEFEVVPGVTSAIAAPAMAGIPVTHRDFASSLHIITGRGRHGETLHIDFEALKRVGGTLVFMMSVAAAPGIAEGLLGAGMDARTPAAVIENGTSVKQRSFTCEIAGLVDMIARENIRSPAVIVVGEVCRCAGRLGRPARPLHGCRVLVTRPREVAEAFGTALRGLGAGVTFYPCIKTRPLEAEISAAGLDWAIFTSAAGVKVFFDKLAEAGSDARALGGVKVAAVGEKTALALSGYGIRADFMPSVFDGEYLARELLDRGCITRGQRAALFRAKNGGAEIARLLREAGVELSDVHIYETVSAGNPPVKPGDFDYVTLTSASCADGFAEANRDTDLTAFTALCIGAKTEAAARRAGMKTIVADTATTEGIVRKLQEVWHGHKTETAQDI